MNRLRYNLFIGQFLSMLNTINIFVIPYLISLYFLDFPISDIVICCFIYILFVIVITVCQISIIKIRKVDLNKFDDIFNDIVYKEKNIYLDSDNIVKFFESLPIELVEKIKKDRLKIYLRNRTEKERKKLVNGYYKVSSNIIVVYSTTDTSLFKTFLHEFAHYIDYSFGRISLNYNFYNYLWKFRLSDYKYLNIEMSKPCIKVGESLLKGLDRGRRIHKIQRFIYYLFGVKYHSISFNVSYGLKNPVELFAELFCNNIRFGNCDFLYIPNNYNQVYFCEYNKFGETEKLVNFFEDILYMKQWKYPKLNVKYK